MAQRIYIIGTGVISGHHAQARQALPRETELYAADPNPEALAKFKAEHPDAVTFPSSDEMLAHAPARDLDIVAVSTPPKWHCSETLKALRSGRNVVCEKPFAMSLDEARQMVDEAKTLGLHVACCSNRFIDWASNRDLKQLLNDGVIGEPYLVDFLHRSSCSRTGVEYQNGSWWFLEKAKNGGGPLLDWGPYDVAVLLELFEPTHITITGAIAQHINVPHGIPDGVTYDIETQAAATLTLHRDAGRDVTVRYERTCCTHGENESKETIYGTKGSATWSWLPFEKDPHVKLRVTRAPRLADETVHPSTPQSDDDTWVHAPVREFDRFLRGDATAPVLVNDDALFPFSMLQGIYQAAETGQPVTVHRTAAKLAEATQ
ncbi:MAG: Gfo/Idh/MocA family oxidoreductase [Planctomycetota bacterium]